MSPIIGKKVVLFELQPIDIPHFAEVHREDKHGYMQSMNLSKMTQEESEKYVIMLLTSLQMIAFVVMTKEGKASRKVGYVYLNDLSIYGCSISGIMLKEFAVGLGRQVRRGKYTYSEDSLITLIDWLYNNFKQLDRIQADVVAENKLSLALINRVGFQKEGILRNYLHLDDKAVDVIVHSLLRSEWKTHESIEQETDIIGSTIPSPSPALV
jgi:RimJ/RimL family protein N-acetyltransferase